jgi:hypothetical protein
VGGCHATRGAWDLAPTGGRRLAAAQVRRARAMCAVRALPTGNREGGTDWWVAAQCRAAVPLIGGSNLLAGAGQRVGHRCVGRPEKERRWAA